MECDSVRGSHSQSLKFPDTARRKNEELPHFSTGGENANEPLLSKKMFENSIVGWRRDFLPSCTATNSIGVTLEPHLGGTRRRMNTPRLHTVESLPKNILPPGKILFGRVCFLPQNSWPTERLSLRRTAAQPLPRIALSIRLIQPVGSFVGIRRAAPPVTSARVSSTFPNTPLDASSYSRTRPVPLSTQAPLPVCRILLLPSCWPSQTPLGKVAPELTRSDSV